MDEVLIKFRTAKLAYEKGFNEFYQAMYYDINGNDWNGLIHAFPFGKAKKDGELFCKCPQSLLQKWLREKHGINFFITFKPIVKKWGFIIYFMSINGKEYVKHNLDYLKLHKERKYDTYEEALEDGIYESLQMLP
jgi:hypothetical protein